MTENWKIPLRRRCMALLALAMLLRMLPAVRSLASGAVVSAPEEQTQSLAAPEPVQPVRSAEPAPVRSLPPLRLRSVSVPEPQTEDPPAREALSLLFTEEDAEALTVRGGCTLPYDKTALLLAPLSAARGDGPQVLIMHTHTTEAYTPEPGWEYEESDLCRTLDPERSVVRVGARIAERLEEAGIGVIHDGTVHDYPAYSGAYERSAETVRRQLAEHPSIRMVLDIHRDAFEEADGSMGSTAADGKTRVLLVLGSDQGGLEHPNWQKNLSAALKLQVLLERVSPGLAKPISLTTQRYNGHLTEMSVLVEFGAAGDTLAEALAAADDFSEALTALLSLPENG